MGSSSLGRDRTQAPCIGSVVSQSLDHLGSPTAAIPHAVSGLSWSLPSCLHHHLGNVTVTLFLQKEVDTRNGEGLYLKCDYELDS